MCGRLTPLLKSSPTRRRLCFSSNLAASNNVSRESLLLVPNDDPRAVIISQTESSIGASVATLLAQVNPNRLDTQVYFEYGLETNYTQRTTVTTLVAGANPVVATKVLSKPVFRNVLIFIAWWLRMQLASCLGMTRYSSPHSNRKLRPSWRTISLLMRRA
jgi:hypothetical protein